MCIILYYIHTKEVSRQNFIRMAGSNMVAPYTDGTANETPIEIQDRTLCNMEMEEAKIRRFLARLRPRESMLP